MSNKNKKDDWKFVNAIGDTAEKIHDACDTLVGVLGQFTGPGSGQIGTFIHPGPEGSKYPWLILAGPAPVMCEHASESALEGSKRIAKKLNELEGDDE